MEQRRTIAGLLLLAIALLTAAPAMAAERLILAFGDSLTAGYRLPPLQGFAPQLQAELQRRGIDARVHNGGVSGETTGQGRARLDRTLAAMERAPDLVIVALGTNDMVRGVPPGEAGANLDAMIAALRKRGIPVVMAGMVGFTRVKERDRADYDAMYRAVARRQGVPLYPLFLKGVLGHPAMLLPDGLHPSARGVAVMARGIAPLVQAMGPRPR